MTEEKAPSIFSLSRRAEDYWLSPAVTEFTPWDPSDPSAGGRQCPRMTAVYDNNKCLLRIMWIFDTVTALAWAIMVVWAAHESAELVGIVGNFFFLGGLTIICGVGTVKATRAERNIVVVGCDDVLGMNDDWLSFKQDDQQGAEIEPDIMRDVTPEPVQTPDDDETEGRVFEFPDEEHNLPDDNRGVG